MTGKIGFMQGRLCDRVDGMIQAFPWQDWEKEFATASAIDLHLMEWTLDQRRLYENPLMTKDGQARIQFLSNRYGIAIHSLTGDCFMQAPFWKASGQACKELQSDFLAVCDACAAVGISIIIVPLVDNGSLLDNKQEDVLVNFLLSHREWLVKKRLRVIFESDFDALELARLMSRLPYECFGVNYDIGNSAALGFSITNEFKAYGERIVNVHVKDRVLGGGSVPLCSGNADFPLVFSELRMIDYNGDYILQTARAIDDDHSGLLVRYRDMVHKWMKSSRPRKARRSIS